jgi:hypothetical protein
MRHLRRDERMQLMSINSALTPFGLLCRSFRIERGFTILDQCLRLHMRPSDVSDIETGRVKVPGGYVGEFSSWLELDGARSSEIERLAKRRYAVRSLPNLTEKQSKFVVRVYRDLRHYSWRAAEVA